MCANVLRGGRVIINATINRHLPKSSRGESCKNKKSLTEPPFIVSRSEKLSSNPMKVSHGIVAGVWRDIDVDQAIRPSKSEADLAVMSSPKLDELISISPSTYTCSEKTTFIAMPPSQCESYDSLLHSDSNSSLFSDCNFSLHATRGSDGIRLVDIDSGKEYNSMDKESRDVELTCIQNGYNSGIDEEYPQSLQF